MSRIQTRALALTLTALAASCSKKTEPPAAPTVLPAVEAPKGLVAEIAIPRPGATWASIRTAMGGPFAMLPASGGMLATMSFDLPPTAGELFDMDIPALGAVVQDDSRFAVVLAFHVKDGPKLAEIASTGDNASYTKKPDAGSGVLFLAPKEDNDGPALGISGNYLTVASRGDDLVRFAPFVTRTLPTRPVPQGDIVATAPRAGLAQVTKLVRAGFEGLRADRAEFAAAMRERFGGHAKPGEPFDYLDRQTERALAVFEDLDTAHLALTLEGGFVRLKLAAKAKTGDGAAARYLATLAPGDAKPLLDLPAESTVAAVFRDTKEARAEGIADQLEMLAQGHWEELKPADKSRIEQALRGWAEGRGDWMSFAGIWNPEGIGFVAHTAVSNPAILDKAMGDFLRLSDIPVFAKPFELVLGPFKLTPPSAQAGLKTVRLNRKPGAVGARSFFDTEALPKQLDVVWSVDENALVTAIGKDAKGTWAPIAKGTGKKLGDLPTVAKLVGALDGDVSFALMAQPRQVISALTGKPAPEEAPVLLSVGRSGTTEAWLRLDASELALRDLAMMASSF